MCHECLAKARISLPEVELIAFSRGPGSFTGLRIGAGVVQGLAFAQDIPVANISSLQALAVHASRQHRETEVVVAVDARMQEIYWAHYSVDAEGNIQELSEERLSKPDKLIIGGEGPVIAIGSGWNTYQDILKNQLKSRQIDYIYANQMVSAEEIARLAANTKVKIGKATEALPVYLRNNVVHQPKPK